MISCEKDALQFFRKRNAEKGHFDKKEFQTCVEVLQKTAAEKGLPETDIDEIVNFFTTTKINAQDCSNLFNCLIPETKITNQSLEQILLWFFTEVGDDSISVSLAKKCVQWLSGVIYYELADISIIESYYYSFIFILSKPHLVAVKVVLTEIVLELNMGNESSVCRLLCLISKPEDAKRWVVQQILHIPGSSNLKPHKSALLSLLKSYNGNVVPEKIPLTAFHYRTTPFDDILKKAHDRKLENNEQTKNLTSSSIQWNFINFHEKKNKKLSRLIPNADSLNDCADKLKGRKVRSVYEIKTMSSLGVQPFHIEYPAESLSLLANTAGYHILAFSDFAMKTRFFHKLYYTLYRVYILELEPYSEEEKKFFLNSVKELEEYTQQSIPVVTTFLLNYLPIWDGVECREQILGLLEWVEMREEDDLEKCIFPALRQIFISSGTHCKCLIIKTMGKLLRNFLIVDKKEQNCFRRDFQNFNVVKSIEAVHAFVSELISSGLIWNNEKKSRDILNSALDFYETSQAVEQAGDLPLIMVMPPALVYSCLFSNSRLCIARMCSLLIRLLQVSVERLYLLGVFQDFTAEVQKLNIYILDYYRCLWSKLDFQEKEESFIFQNTAFTNKMWKLKDIFGDVMDKIFGVDYNSSFWNPKAKGLREVVLGQLAEDYPSVVQLKQVIEERLSQAF